MVRKADLLGGKKKVEIICNYLGYKRLSNDGELWKTGHFTTHYLDFTYDFLIESYAKILDRVPEQKLSNVEFFSLNQHVKSSLLSLNKYLMLAAISNLANYLHTNEIGTENR